MCMDVCVLMNLSASLGKIIIIPINTIVGAEVSIHTFGAICGNGCIIGVSDP